MHAYMPTQRHTTVSKLSAITAASHVVKTPDQQPHTCVHGDTASHNRQQALLHYSSQSSA
jgi:hypothetical protein